MQRKQSLATNADLIELLKQTEIEQPEEKVILLEDDLFSFLMTFNIENGENLVLKSVIYDLYKQWSEYPLNRISFGTKMSRYLHDHKKGSKDYYKVNKNSFFLNAELLKYLEKNKLDKTKYIPWKNHFEQFLNYYEIQPGNKWIPNSVFKHLYNKWCYNNNKKILLSNLQLFRFLKLYFKFKRNGVSRMQWFSVSENFVIKHVTKDMLNPIPNKRKMQNEKKQKTASKIPSTSTRTKSKN